METLFRVGLFSSINSAELPNPPPLFPRISPFHRLHALSRRTPSVSSFRTPLTVSELAGEDVLQIFLKERQLNGDFISKVSDVLWRRDVVELVDSEASLLADNPQQLEEVMKNENEGGFLKLTQTNEWISGDNTAPINKKAVAKELQDDSERRKRLNILEYEAIDVQLHRLYAGANSTESSSSQARSGENDASTSQLPCGNFVVQSGILKIKREMLLLTASIGTACSGYCLVALSVQAAISYAAGVLFSCLYLQLLYHHADNLSRDAVPPVFMLKKSKKIGIRSEDLKNLFERTAKGSTIALSSPRLVIPAAIYGLWALSQHFSRDFFDFQLVPAMLGMFAYKAAALVQVYRDNEDLRLDFPESEEGSSAQ